MQIKRIPQNFEQLRKGSDNQINMAKYPLTRFKKTVNNHIQTVIDSKNHLKESLLTNQLYQSLINLKKYNSNLQFSRQKATWFTQSLHLAIYHMITIHVDTMGSSLRLILNHCLTLKKDGSTTVLMQTNDKRSLSTKVTRCQENL